GPEPGTSDQIMCARPSADPHDVADRLIQTIERADAERRTGPWRCRDQTILVLQVIDCPLSELAPLLDSIGPGHFANHGFAEVFVADHAELAHRKLEVFGLHPRRRWGHYRRDRCRPYG